MAEQLEEFTTPACDQLPATNGLKKDHTQFRNIYCYHALGEKWQLVAQRQSNDNLAYSNTVDYVSEGQDLVLSDAAWRSLYPDVKEFLFLHTVDDTVFTEVDIMTLDWIRVNKTVAADPAYFECVSIKGDTLGHTHSYLHNEVSGCLVSGGDYTLIGYFYATSYTENLLLHDVGRKRIASFANSFNDANGWTNSHIFPKQFLMFVRI
eukprot:TRINITY_DN5128_c0_g1_i1.p1 TRINITY_DN5128_c0_g1~~TRINITY_DN5128_c0_g1_i1.p1  ORF type:complete len:220 (+),score=29.69 TRINITY_DN5128_c0_g1_i1:41-661(+)